jgi:hypothetical protein
MHWHRNPNGHIGASRLLQCSLAICGGQPRLRSKLLKRLMILPPTAAAVAG